MDRLSSWTRLLGPPHIAATPRGFAMPSSRKLPSSFTALLVTGDCFFIGLSPILVYMSKVDGKFPFNPVSVNLLSEVAKTLFACAMLLCQGRSRKRERVRLTASAVTSALVQNSLLAVPAFFYAVNNYLKFAMQLYFRPLTVKMLANLKILTIALLLSVIMRRRFSVLQLEALLLLLIGISINTLPCGSNPETPSSLPVTALLCTLFYVTVPSCASVFNEFALKKNFDVSLHVQNVFLYGFGAAFNSVALILYVAISGQSWNVFTGHNWITMLLVANNAAQGILSSFFFKFADTILKKYSSSIATIFTGLASAVLFGHTLTPNFVIGITVVFISMHQFFAASNHQPHKTLPEKPYPLHASGKGSDGMADGHLAMARMASKGDEQAQHGAKDSRMPLLPT